MSVPNQIPESNYVGNGTTTTFAANFEYASDSDVFVTVNGVTPEIGQATFANGVFTFTTAPANGAAVRVYRSTPIERDTEYDNHDNVFRPRVVNIDFDRVWFVLQEYLLSLGITNARVTQEIVDRIQADAEMMNYILNEDNELKADYILRDENLKKYVDQTIGAIIGNPDFQGIEAQFVKDASGKNQQEINDSLVLVGDKLKREFVSVFDFFTPDEYATYKASPTTFDAFRPLQEFLTSIAANNYGVAYCSGKFRVSKGLVCNVTGDSLNSTRTVIGELDVTCLNAIDTTIDFTLGQDFNWFGKVIARGQGGVSVNSRTCQTGIRISTSSRAYFHKLVARTYIGHGVYLPDGDTLLKIGEVRTSDCGSGHYDTGSQLTNFTSTAKTGSASSVAQRQVITVNDLPKFSRDDYYNVLIDGQPYFVSATNRTTKELTIFPWLPTTTTDGSLKYLYGAGIAVYGGDSSEVIIDSIDCVRTGTAYINGALYSANVNVLQTQSCGVAMQFGSSPSSATVGGVIQNMYCEANAIDILRCTRSTANFAILSDVSLDLSKTRYVSSPRDGSDNLILYNNLNGFTIFKNGVVQSRSIIGNLELTNSQEPVLYGNNYISNLTIDESVLQAYPDLMVKKVFYIGSGANQQPTIGITLNPPVGYTLNGQASLSFTGLSKPLEVTLGLRLGTKSIIVTTNHTSTSSVTYDPPSLTAAGTAGDSVSTTVTLTGATVGTPVQAAFSQYNAAIEISAQVSAANTVTVKFKNTSAAAVDLPSGTLTVKMI